MSGKPLQYAVVDLFSGPGGLAEGFSQVKRQDGTSAFNIRMSVEKDAHAHLTLRMRAFFRAFEDDVPDEYFEMLRGERTIEALICDYPSQWREACRETFHLCLGEPDADVRVERRIKAIRRLYGDRTILIGGPPCQAYSIIGRSRNMGLKNYNAADDDRHFLYRRFLASVEALRPAAFVMENVKGMLTSSVEGSLISRMIVRDLQGAAEGYDLYPLDSDELVAPSKNARDFLVRAENHGVPQKRHRVIIVGLRRDLSKTMSRKALDSLSLAHREEVSTETALKELPTLDGQVSSRYKTGPTWKKLLETHKASLVERLAATMPDVAIFLKDLLVDEVGKQPETDSSPEVINDAEACFRAWVWDKRVAIPPNGDVRGHMPSDLERYLFAAAFAAVHDRSPNASEYPGFLAPDHANWKTGAFADRFRVQVASKPATTVTSHISKDGHYYIHPDPRQNRSLTVREAARIQTFPDNYLFLGPRTSQYHQVGNAVPPLLAYQIGQKIFETLSIREQELERGESGMISPLATYN